MKIERMLTSVEFSESDHKNLYIVVNLLQDLVENLREHGENSIQSTVDGSFLDVCELADIVAYLEVLTNAQKFIVCD